MRAAQILSSLDRSRVDEVSRALGVDHSGSKDEVVPRIAAALGLRKDASGKPLGVDGALRALFPLLTRADLLKCFGDLTWNGESASYVPHPGLWRFNEFELRDLFLALCNAEQENARGEVDNLCSSDRFGDVFRAPSNATAAVAKTTPPPPRVAPVFALRAVEPEPQNEERKLARMRERVASLLAKLLRLGDEPLPPMPDDFPLAGWWQAELPKQRWFLPALNNDAINARVGELLVCLKTRQAMPSIWRTPLELVPEAMFQAFANAVVRANVKVRYVALAGASTAGLIEMVEALARPAPFAEIKFEPEPSIDWLKVAERLLRGEADDTVVLAGPDGEITLSLDEHQKLHGAWEHFHLVLAPNPDAAAVQLFVGLVSRMPGVSEISAEKINAVLMPSARAGNFLERLELPTKVPTLPQARAVLRGLAAEKRREASEKLYKAFFVATHAELAGFLLALASLEA